MRLVVRFVAVLVCLLAFGAASAQDALVKSFPAFGESFSSRLSPDGTLLATFESGVIHADEIFAEYLPIRVYDVTRGEAVATLTGEPDYAVDVSFSPDGAQLAALYPTGWLHVWTVADGETVTRLPIAPNGGRLAWLPDGNTLAVATGQLPQIQLWDVTTGAMTALLMPRFETVAEQREALSSGVPDGLAAFAVAPDGSRFAISTYYDRIQFWTPTGEMTTIYDPDAEQARLSIQALTFTPDGSRLLALHTMDNKVRVFDAADGQLITEIESARIRSRALAVSPDGTRAAWVTAPEDGDAVVVVAELATGETLDVPLPAVGSPGWTTPMTGLFFSGDGQRLILTGQFLRATDEPGPDQNPVYIIPLPR